MKMKRGKTWTLAASGASALAIFVLAAVIIAGRTGLAEARGQVLDLRGAGEAGPSLILQAEADRAWGFYEWPGMRLYGFVSLGPELRGVRKGSIVSGTGKGSEAELGRKGKGAWTLRLAGPGLPESTPVLEETERGAGPTLSGFSARDGRKFRLALLSAAGGKQGMVSLGRLRRGMEPGAYARDLLGRAGGAALDEREYLLPAVGGLRSFASERGISGEGGREERYLRFLILDELTGAGKAPAELLGSIGEGRLSFLLTREAARALGLGARGKESAAPASPAEGRSAQDRSAQGPAADLRAFGLFDAALRPSAEVFVCRSGLGFHYDRYELAPYDKGDFSFVLAWDQLPRGLAP